MGKIEDINYANIKKLISHVNVASWPWDRPLNTKWDLLRFLILPYSKMIYNKNILHLNKGGISSDTRKF